MLQISIITEAKPKEMSQQNHHRARQGQTRQTHLVIAVIPERSQLPEPDLYRYRNGIAE